MKLTEYEERIIYDRFGIPKVGEGLLEVLFNAGELSLLLHGNDEFAAEAYPKEFIANAYHRGVISKCDESGRRYRISDFYSMLDVFAVSRKDEYDALPAEKRKALDDWYFDAYYERLEPAEEATKDVVLTLDETLEFIDGQERQAYLNFCDCRMLKGDCGFPTDTCVTYKDGINSFVDRGLSKKISKEEAKDVIRRADAAGLMHTAGMGGICNCCGDCCYLFRAQQRRGSVGVWPSAKHIVSLDAKKCVGCGKCVKRCHFGVFTLEKDMEDTVISEVSNAENKAGTENEISKVPDTMIKDENRRKKFSRVTCDATKCVGCGLCANTCPTGALQMTDRTTKTA